MVSISAKAVLRSLWFVEARHFCPTLNGERLAILTVERVSGPETTSQFDYVARDGRAPEVEGTGATLRLAVLDFLERNRTA